jgi:replicative DNA helicase
VLPPPHDLAAEEAVLHAGLWADVEAHATGLEPADFWAPQHREIWAVLLSVEKVLGCDAGWTTRVWAASHVLLELHQRRLLELLYAAPLGRVATDVERVRTAAERRRAILLLQRAEARLREKGVDVECRE